MSQVANSGFADAFQGGREFQSEVCTGHCLSQDLRASVTLLAAFEEFLIHQRISRVGGKSLEWLLTGEER